MLDPTDPNFNKIRNLTKATGDAAFARRFDIASAAVLSAAPKHVTPATLHHHATCIALPSWGATGPGRSARRQHAFSEDIP